jgi:hypothetical protein
LVVLVPAGWRPYYGLTDVRPVSSISRAVLGFSYLPRPGQS